MFTLVLGLGNPLLGDEGVGVHIAQAILAEPPLQGVVALDVGTAVLDALPALEAAERVVVVDAMKAGGPPGSVYRVPFDRVAANGVIASVHGFDLGRVLAMARRDRPPDVVVIGVEPAVVDWSLELSPAVAEAVPAILDAVRAALDQPSSAAATAALEGRRNP